MIPSIIPVQRLSRLVISATVVTAALWLVGRADTASAQYAFGKNKVHYTEFDWLILSTEHFDIYFYEAERPLADVTAEAAERIFDQLADRFNHHIAERTPLIIYSSPRFFSQTNVIPSLLPENVAGFTEFVKGRVVLPFQGSYPAFRRVLHHELVHVFTISKLAAVAGAHRRTSTASPPLWFTEGLAEFFSRSWEPEADMILSDLVLSGRFYNLDRIDAIAGTYLMYKEGESFCHFIADTYGAEHLVYFLDNWWRGSDFAAVVQVTLGKTLADIGREWEYWLKKKYFPSIRSAELPDRVFTQITKSGFNVKPVPVRVKINGQEEERIVFKGNRLGYTGLYMTPCTGHGDNGNVVTLLKGERSPRFESLHLLGSSMDGSQDGRVIFSSTRHERDVLYELDAATRHIVAEYQWDSLYDISSPAYSPDGQRIVFSAGGIDGIFDLYLLDRRDRSLRRLTSDWYFDVDPEFTPDGERIIFASDRGEHGDEGWLNLFVLELASGRIAPHFTGRFNARAPSFAPDGRAMVFTCDRAGHADVYRIDSTGRLERLTSLVTGAFDPRFRPDGKGIVLAAYQNTSFQIFAMDFPESTQVEQIARTPEAWTPTWSPALGTGELANGAVKYQRRFSFDVAQSAVSYDAFYGTVGGFQTSLTDILGNHQYYFLLANNADTKDDFFESFSVALSFFNREHRINYGYGVFHLFDDYVDRHDGPIEERQYGAVGYLGYPLSRFRRIEGSLFLRQSDRRTIGEEPRRAVLATQFISLVHDNSLWEITGPIDGWRFMLTLGYTGNLSSFRSFNRLALVDVRKYFRLGAHSAFAMRAMGHFSGGSEPQRRYLGGSWDLRGYPRRAEYARNVVLFSNELRFPLIDALFVGLPIGAVGAQAIRGALFFDAGNAWEDDFGRIDGALGVGARVALGYFIVLRMDWARRTDFKTIDNKTRFEFFFGWNF